MFSRSLKLSYMIVLLIIMVAGVCLINFYNLYTLKRAERFEESEQDEEVEEIEEDVNENIHAFYYAWYGNVQFDDKYIHWNHPYLEDWHKNSKYNAMFRNKSHTPPNDIGSNFYPSLGVYSSKDPMIIKLHMHLLKRAKIGVIAVSWYPLGKSDDQGVPRDENFYKELLDSAEYGGIKVCFHLEPYKGRTADSVAGDIKYLLKTYGEHGALYRRKRKLPEEEQHRQQPNWEIPLFYVYDSYLVPSRDWSRVLVRGGGGLRDREQEDVEDFLVIALVLHDRHMKEVKRSGFDGFYTYFASELVSEAAKPSNWLSYSRYADANNLLFIPSVGPGYIDTSIRPWNGGMTVERREGGTYRDKFEQAIATSCPIVSLTSFNEWHEGTQIEPAVMRPLDGAPEHYPPYASAPDFYLKLTRQLVNQFERRK